MKYKYSVIGDNTQENREWLEKVGHENWFDNVYGDILYTPIQYRTDKAFYQTTHIEKVEAEAINCLGNSPLFKAVSAMREDSDKDQWYTNGKDWCKCYLPIFSHFAFHQQVEASIDLISNWHKATLTELQERFKEKEK